MKLMKNTLNRPLLKTVLFSTFALACVAPPPQVKAQQTGPLVFIEVNDVTLIATLGFGGPAYGTVAPGPGGGVDSWTWTPPTGAQVPLNSFGGLQGAQWLEPPPQTAPPEVNTVLVGGSTAANSLGLVISSDVGLNRNLNLPPFNNTELDPQFLMLDPSAPGGMVVGMAFIDNGDATVPDGGLTLGMLGTTMVGLALIGRRFVSGKRDTPLSTISTDPGRA